MENENEMLDCYIVPSAPLPFILPQECIADVVARPEIITPESKTAAWIRGHCDWQEQRLSVMCYDSLIDNKVKAKEMKNANLVVLNPVHGSARLVYTALLCAGDVQKIEIDMSTEFIEIPASLDKRYVESAMSYKGADYIIPKLSALAVAFSYI